jgi:hypothetical protein
MKKLLVFLSVLVPFLCASCGQFQSRYPQLVGIARPKPKGTPATVIVSSYDAKVYDNCVGFTQQPNLGLLSPVEVWVYNLDRDSANTFDSVWIRPAGPSSWQFYQSADLPRGVSAVPNTASPEDAFIWMDHAQKARDHAWRRQAKQNPGSYGTDVPKRTPKSLERPGWKKIVTDDGTVVWEKLRSPAP